MTKLENWHEPSSKSEITGFYMGNIANLLGDSTLFLSPCFCNCLFCGRRFFKTSVCISCCRSWWLICLNLMKLSAITYPPSTSLNGFTIFFGAFSLFIIPFTREMHWPPAVFIVLTSWCLVGLCRVFTFNLICKQVKIESGKTQVARRHLSTKFLKPIFVLMRALPHKKVRLILNDSIASSPVLLFLDLVLFWQSVTR